jgi:hypothetical protein
MNPTSFPSPEPLYAQSFGYSLAMRVLQSDLYPTLDDQQRAECDEFIARGQGRAAAPQPPEPVAKKLWLWKNFVDGRPEYWAFDNAYPINLDNGDPQTLGEPCGYALFKPSRTGRTDVSEEQVLRAIERASAAPQPDLHAAPPEFDEWRKEAERLKTCVDYAPSGLAAIEFRDQLLRHLRTATKKAPHPLDALLPEICQLIDSCKTDWEGQGCWSAWDQSVRDRITAYNLSPAADPTPPKEAPQAFVYGVVVKSTAARISALYGMQREVEVIVNPDSPAAPGGTTVYTLTAGKTIPATRPEPKIG